MITKQQYESAVDSWRRVLPVITDVDTMDRRANCVYEAMSLCMHLINDDLSHKDESDHEQIASVIVTASSLLDTVASAKANRNWYSGALSFEAAQRATATTAGNLHLVYLLMAAAARTLVHLTPMEVKDEAVEYAMAVAAAREAMVLSCCTLHLNTVVSAAFAPKEAQVGYRTIFREDGRLKGRFHVEIGG